MLVKPSSTAADKESMNDTGNEQHLSEEIANALSHGFGLLLSLVGLAALIVLAANGDGWHMGVCLVYGISLVLVYASSTLYHGVRRPETKRVLGLIDHICIYLLIAGTYTPFTLIYLRHEGSGWTLFIAIWSAALLGTLFKLIFRMRYRMVSTVLYVAMGWLGITTLGAMIEHIPDGALILILTGGVLYTAGVFFYWKDHRPYFHMVWHFFVLAASACHYAAILVYVIPGANA